MSEENKEKWNVIEMATATEPRASDGENVYTTLELLVIIMRKLERLEKKIVG